MAKFSRRYLDVDGVIAELKAKIEALSNGSTGSGPDWENTTTKSTTKYESTFKKDNGNYVTKHAIRSPLDGYMVLPSNINVWIAPTTKESSFICVSRRANSGNAYTYVSWGVIPVQKDVYVVFGGERKDVVFVPFK